MEFLFEIDPMVVASLTFGIAGIVELYRRLFTGDWKTAGTIAVSGLAGMLLSYAVGLTWFEGLLIGFSTSGVITTVSHFRSL